MLRFIDHTQLDTHTHTHTELDTHTHTQIDRHTHRIRHTHTHTIRHTHTTRNAHTRVSARHRSRYLHETKQHKRRTSMPSVGFETAISAIKRPQTYALDSTVRGSVVCIMIR